MQIYSRNNINFKAISLNKEETKRVDGLLLSVENPVHKEQAKLELFDVFDKHLQKEAKSKAAVLYHEEDFLQRLYLTFLESLENAKSLTTKKLLTILNDVEPNSEEIQEIYRKGTVSINENLDSDDSRSLEYKLSEDSIQKPLSAVSQEERAEKLKTIQELAGHLSQKEQDLLTRRANGKSYKEISEDLGISFTTIYNRIRTALLKIQLKNGVLPEEYELFADKFIKTFGLDISRKEMIDFIINNINLTQNLDRIKNNVETTSKLLKINKKLFIKAALKQPQLFCQKPESILNKVEDTSKLLGIDRKQFIKAGLVQPPLFSQKPETILENIENTSKLLKVDKKSLVNAALQHPRLFSQKPETTLKNIQKASKLLKVDKKSLINAALKQPILFCLKPETIVRKANITKYYDEIRCKKSSELSFLFSSDKELFYNILTCLIKEQDKLSRPLKHAQIVKYLKNRTRVYTFVIPQNKFADEFIKYAKEFSQSNLGKQVFNFVKK